MRNHWNGFCLISVPTTTLQQAWKQVDWYADRWLVEDAHQCLKSGCRIEQRQLQDVENLIRLLGLLSPLAIRLLQLREGARVPPDRPASEVIEPLMLAVVAERASCLPPSLTLGTFWMEVERMGGIWLVPMMVLLDGGPSGRAGSLFKHCLRVFTSLFTSVCKMWVRISLERTGLPAVVFCEETGVGSYLCLACPVCVNVACYATEEEYNWHQERIE